MVAPNPFKIALNNAYIIIMVAFLGVNPNHFVEEIPRGIYGCFHREDYIKLLDLLATNG